MNLSHSQARKAISGEIQEGKFACSMWLQALVIKIGEDHEASRSKSIVERLQASSGDVMGLTHRIFYFSLVF
ncbi:hypothetical protein MYX84_10890 [Acidobacteria bacterium AH-259-O06]|nr:hypothetical protein [Acidobacteria bacterium AH-259-O06]